MRRAVPDHLIVTRSCLAWLRGSPRPATSPYMPLGPPSGLEFSPHSYLAHCDGLLRVKQKAMMSAAHHRHPRMNLR